MGCFKMRTIMNFIFQNTSNLTASLVLALGVCYHASLKKREEFRKEITPMFLNPFPLEEGSKQMLKIIERYTCFYIIINKCKLIITDNTKK